MRGDALVETGEAAAGSDFCILRFLLPRPIVDYLSTNGSMLMGESDEAVPRAAVPDHVGHTLAHRPGEHRIYRRFQLPESVFNLACDPCRREYLPGTVQFALKPGLSIPGDGHSHLAPGLACHALDLAHLLHRPRRLLLDETPCQFALECDHGQDMPKQSMEVACQACSLLLDLQPSQFSSYSM